MTYAQLVGLRLKLQRSDERWPDVRVATYLLNLCIGSRRANCWPTHETIARKTRSSVSTVKRALKRLRANGWLDWRQQKTRASMACRRLVANRYWFATEAVGSVKMTERKAYEVRSNKESGNEQVEVQPMLAELARLGYRRDPFRPK